MKLILLQNVRNVGQGGDVVDVADGFGRNFLLPRGLARPATAAAVMELEKQRQLGERRAKGQEKQAKAVAGRLAGLVLERTLAAAESGTLYAALKEKEILAMVRKSAAGLPQSARLVDYEPIKNVGGWEVTVELVAGVRANIKLNIKSDAPKQSP